MWVKWSQLLLRVCPQEVYLAEEAWSYFSKQQKIIPSTQRLKTTKVSSLLMLHVTMTTGRTLCLASSLRDPGGEKRHSCPRVAETGQCKMANWMLALEASAQTCRISPLPTFYSLWQVTQPHQISRGRGSAILRIAWKNKKSSVNGSSSPHRRWWRHCTCPPVSSRSSSRKAGRELLPLASPAAPGSSSDLTAVSTIPHGISLHVWISNVMLTEGV